jgi:hypothetical protein
VKEKRKIEYECRRSLWGRVIDGIGDDVGKRDKECTLEG